jgi:hypothetical protein
MPIEPLLSRLEKVQKTGGGRYMALCPAHADKGRSLSLRELDDGRVLIKCFAGCETHEVLQTVGMTFHDIMPECLGDKKAIRRGFDAYSALKAINFEATVLRMIAKTIKEGRPLSQDDRQRAGKAERIIQDALDAVNGSLLPNR